MLLIKPGFADYKYDSAWVVLPDPNGGYQIADFAMRMAAMDPLLPKRERMTYHGTFRKSHLAAALLIIKQGTHKWPDSDRFITADQGNDSLQETLRLGMWCISWAHEDVVANLDAFKLLMASDNWEADEQMGDCELAVTNRIVECMATVHSGVGVSMDQAVIARVKRICSTAWTDSDLYTLLDYAKTTTPQALEILRIFQRLTTDPTVFNVPIRHFKDVTEAFGLNHQWIKTSFTCAMYAADRKTEVKKSRWPWKGGTNCYFPETH